MDMPDGAIAIIGMAGRFPGARGVDQLWRNLRDGVSGITFFDDGAPRPEGHVPAGALLPDVDLFDASFFDISRRDAELLDPQRRLFLECAWEALESAGVDPFACEGAIGVYAGVTASSYLSPGIDFHNNPYHEFQLLLSNDKDFLATYLAYKLNLRGPCVSVQTACSTSLVAVHTACASLLDRECDVALAGGVTVRLSRKKGYKYEDGFILSPDGHCRAFDQRAQGTVFGNGVGIVVLKRLSEAMADGDPIRAVIRGSAVNNDGSLKIGFTAPSVVGQAQVIAEALGVAGVDPRTIQYIEAHGTGTPLGDSIEIAALKQVFGARADEKGKIAIGALKSSVGHLESASGVTGLIKTVLALLHRRIPANPGFETPNPDLGIDDSPFYIRATSHDWEAGAAPRRAGVSSFGIGGTNAHVVVEEAPERPRAKAPPDGRAALLPLSARSRAALESLAQSYSAFLRETTPGAHDLLGDVLYTASVRRRHHEHRLGVVGTSKDELAAALDAYARGEARPGLVQGKAAVTAPKVVFIFPGQGSQWAGMGRTLLEEEHAFRQAIEACDAAIQREAGFSVLAELTAAEEQSRLGEIDVAQPVLFAIEVALAALWRSWGVEPSAVVGHSMGEVAAAHVVGALTLEDAARVICRRSRILRKVSGKGAMALVELPMAEAAQAIAGHTDRLSVAVSNGPRSTVLAGDPAALDEVLAKLEGEQVFCRRVKVDVASHSPQMDPLRAELLAALAGLRPQEASVPMRSTVTGERLAGALLLADYWADNLRKPVLFSQVTQELIQEGHTLFLEMSPHPILLPSVEENLRERASEGAAIASLRRQQSERPSLLDSLGKLYVHGYPVNWKKLYPEGGRVVGLPAYPWQRERFWIESSVGPAGAPRKAQGAHPLLGAALLSSTHADERTWEHSLSVESTPYLADHRVEEQVVFPGAGYVEMALAAGAAQFGASEFLLENVVFEEMLALAADGERIVQMVLTEEGSGRCTFQIASRTEDTTTWTKHASGGVSLERREARPEQVAETKEALEKRREKALPVAAHYQRMRARQLNYGPAFQGLVELWEGDGSAVGRVRLPDEVEDSGYRLHPALLDACLQVAAGLFSSPESADTLVPVGIARLSIRKLPSRGAWVVATRRAEGETAERESTCDLQIVDDDGQLLIEIEGFRARRLLDAAHGAKDVLDGCVHEVIWQKVEPLPEAPLQEDGAWLVFSDKSGVGAALGGRLSGHRRRAVRVLPGSSYERIEPDLYRIDPSKPGDYERLLKEALGEEGRCQGAVHFFSLDATPLAETTLETLESDMMRGSVSAAYLGQAIVRHGFRDAPRLVLVTRGAQAVRPGEPVSIAEAPLWGLGKTIALEHPELQCTRIDLDPVASDEDAVRLARELAAVSCEDQIALRGSLRYVARIILGRFERDDTVDESQPLLPAQGRPFQLLIRRPGVLDRITPHEMQPMRPGPGEVVIEVEAAGLNFRDVLLALGMLPDDMAGADQEGPRLGGECAGRVVAVGEGVTGLAPGQEVCALASRAFGSFALAKSALCARKPVSLRWEEAATLPVVFLTAYYALEHVGRLRKGERVLIHAGAGGVGLAAIQWASHVGAEIFATAGSEEKRTYLRELGVPHVLDSRSLDFVEEVKRITKGEGIDVVLNSLSGEFIPASLSLLRDHGRFLEIGKRDYYANKQLGLRPFLRNLSFSLVDLGGVSVQRPEMLGALLCELLGMFEAGTLKPLPVTTFPASRAVDAFQYMAQAKHIGKIAIAMKDPDARIATDHRDKAIALRGDACYLITGGLGGLGISLASWLVEQGARSLVLAGRRGPDERAERAIEAMKEAGANVLVAQVDVSKRDELAQLLSTIERTMPPLGGIVHTAVVLDDHTLLELDEASFRRAFAPKVHGAWNLHTLTEHYKLDFFLMYSSVGALLGSPGQGNYTAANAFLDALSHERERRGLTAMSIQWGGFAEVGLAAAQDNRGKRLSHRGIGSFSPTEGLLALRRLLSHPRAEVSVVRFNVRQWIEFYPAARDLPLLAELIRQGAAPRGSDEKKAARQRLEEAEPSARLPLLLRHILEQVAAVLRLDPDRIERSAAFQSLGVDSLMSLELRNRFEATLGIRLSATILFTYPTPDTLGRQLLGMLGLSEATIEKAETTEKRSAIEVEIDHLSSDELLGALARELEDE